LILILASPGSRSIRSGRDDLVPLDRGRPVVSQIDVLRRVDGLPAPDEVSDRIRAMLATLRMEEEL
jgi:hypothetical protein